VTFEVAHSLTATNPTSGLTLEVTVRSATATLTSGRWMGPAIAADSTVAVAVAGEAGSVSSGPLAISIRVKGATGPLVLAAHDGSAACAAVGPIADGLKVAFAEPGSIIYQRLDALPRIRWASTSVVIAGGPQRVAALKAGVPPSQVVLSQPGPAGSGQGATVSVINDDGDTIAAKVNAKGSGYLVVADAMQQPGWSVTVDGRPARLVAADDAMVAVQVPAGTHRIAFEYTTPGQDAGALLSGVAVLFLVAILAWPRRSRRRASHFKAPGGDSSAAQSEPAA
jgi:hypothetical protein